MQQGHQVKLSTRSDAKQAELQQAGFDACVVDIDTATAVNPVFLNADTLIINITSKHIDGFKQLIEAVTQSPIKQVLFVSSSSVYQNLNREVSEDEGAEDADSPLFQIENLFREATGFTTTIIRFSGLVGAGRHPGRFFRGGKQVQQPGAPINLIHFDDCIGIIDAIVSQAAWGQVFNACSDTHPDKREFYTHATQLAGNPPPSFATAQTPSFKIVGNQKIKQQLGYQLQHPDLLELRDYDVISG